MTNNERFCQALNACQDPRRVYWALLAFVSNGRREEPQGPLPALPLPLSRSQTRVEAP